MIRNIQIFCLAIICLFSISSIAARSPLDISLRSIDGSNHKLSEYIGHGQWVVLNIWGTDCPPCQEEIPELVSFHDAQQDNDAIVVGIAIDFPSYGYANKQQVIEFAESHFIDFPILLSDSTITEQVGFGRLAALPSTYLFNPAGKVVAMQVGSITKTILENYIYKLKLKSSGSDKH